MTEPVELAACPRYSEGVVLAADGCLYYSMTPLSLIVAVTVEHGQAEQRVWAHVPGANGHAVRPDGSHVVMSSTGALLELDPTGRTSAVYATSAGGRRLVYPNDVAVAGTANAFYVTDSGYESMPERIDGPPQGRVVRVDGDGNVDVVADGIAYANGIAFSPDGRTLYIGESVTRTIWAYGVEADGTLGARTLFATLPVVPGAKTVPDGIIAGSDGRLYVAHYGAGEVLVYEANGTLQRRLAAGNRAASHVCLDEANATAYVSGGVIDEAGRGAIFRIRI